MKKAIFFDIDGTLINIYTGQTQMTKTVREAILALRKAGHYTFIASGRPLAFLDPELREPGLFDGYVLMNGAAVLVHDKIIYEAPLPKKAVKEILTIADENNIEYILETYPEVYLKSEYHGLAKTYQEIKINVADFVRQNVNPNDIDICKIEFLSASESVLPVFKKFLAMPGFTGLIDPTINRYLELYSAAVSKATGIEKVLEYLDVPLVESYAFGDGLNDIEMMSTVGNSMVMGNAAPELKAKADVVLPTVDEDGVAEGIYQYILKSK